MKLTAEIIVNADESLIKALSVEPKDFKRSKLKIEKIKQGIKFTIMADDVVAFRATLNSLTQFLAIYEKNDR